MAPCYQTGSRAGDLALDNAELREQHHNMTEWLCMAMPFVENTRALEHMPIELQAWWHEHKKIDDARRDRERIERENQSYIDQQL